MRLTLKAILAVLLALALAGLGGWIWGAAGASKAADGLARAGLRLHLANARGNLLAARVSLFEVNFGEASRSLENARADLVTVAEALDRLRLNAEAAAAREALARVDEAQQMTGRLDQGAQARLADAIRRLPSVP